MPRFRLLVPAPLALGAAACSDRPNGVRGPADLQVVSEFPLGFERLRAALIQARNENNGGLNLDMWATIVDRDGVVIAVAFTGTVRGDQ